MRIAHRYNWHYAPPIYPENDIQLWCQWCGFRQTIHRGGPMISGGQEPSPRPPTTGLPKTAYCCEHQKPEDVRPGDLLK